MNIMILRQILPILPASYNTANVEQIRATIEQSMQEIRGYKTPVNNISTETERGINFAAVD